MNEKQIKTLLLFSQYYSLEEIAEQLNVCIGTIQHRLKRIKKHYPEYFDNAIRLRKIFKKAKRSIERPLCVDFDTCEECIPDTVNLDNPCKNELKFT